jgi:hypothetical protein
MEEMKRKKKKKIKKKNINGHMDVCRNSIEENEFI